jgi:F-type H+-transporting ATPase subunit gamma
MAALRSLVRPALAAQQGVRGMATLQEISIRLTSVKSIAKITASMKMVSAAKFARAEKLLQASRSIGPSSIALVEKAGLEVDESGKSVTVAISSDRGLCGGIHSGVCRFIRADALERPEGVEDKLVLIGDKARGIMARTHADDILWSAKGVGRKPPVFAEASFSAQGLLDSGYEWTKGKVVFNWFKNAGTYICQTRPLVNAAANKDAEALMLYDDVDEAGLLSYTEFNMANNIFYSMLESAASEQSARMAAMENATNNANDMIDSLTQQYNRTRQSVITTELIEIISGASAME